MKLKLANGALLYIFHWKRHYGHDLDRSLQFSKHAIFSSKMAMIMISPISNGTSIDAVFIVISLGNFRFVNVVIQSTMQNCRSFLASSHFLKEGVAHTMLNFPIGIAWKIGEVKLFSYVEKTLKTYVFIA